MQAIEAKEKFLSLLSRYKDRHGVEIYAYCLMDNHPHVICVSKLGQKAFSAFWQNVNSRFAQWLNFKLKRKGQVVRERIKSPQIQVKSGNHLLRTMRYVEMNPVRAKMVKSPSDYRFSSHRHHALGSADALISDCPAYLALGHSPLARRKAYLALFFNLLREELNNTVLREAVQNIMRKADFVGSSAWVANRKRDALDANRPPS